MEISFIHSYFTKYYKRLLFIFIAFVAIADALFLFNTFIGWDDYVIYTYSAEAAAEGYNPYKIPEEFRSQAIDYFWVGGTQYEKGKVAQGIINNLPLYIWLSSKLFKTLGLKGIYYALIVSFVFVLFLCGIFSLELRKTKRVDDYMPFLLIFFLGLTPIFLKFWFRPIEDKPMLALFVVILLLLKKKPYLFTLCVALFAAMKGLGHPIFFFYIIYSYREKVSFKNIFYMILLYLFVFSLSHIFYYPDWIEAYKSRIGRQSMIGHKALLTVPRRYGLYFDGLGSMLTVLCLSYVMFNVWFKKLSVEQIVVLSVAFSLMFNGEASIDRILVIVFTLLLFSNNYRIWIINIFLGLLLYKFGRTESIGYLHQLFIPWAICWGWVFLLLWNYMKNGSKTGQKTGQISF